MACYIISNELTRHSRNEESENFANELSNRTPVVLGTTPLVCISLRNAKVELARIQLYCTSSLLEEVTVVSLLKWPQLSKVFASTPKHLSIVT